MDNIKVSIILSCLPALMVTMKGAIDSTSGTAFAFIMALGMYFFLPEERDEDYLPDHGFSVDTNPWEVLLAHMPPVLKNFA
jgi:hypothetical protein